MACTPQSSQWDAYSQCLLDCTCGVSCLASNLDLWTENVRSLRMSVESMLCCASVYIISSCLEPNFYWGDLNYMDYCRNRFVMMLDLVKLQFVGCKIWFSSRTYWLMIQWSVVDPESWETACHRVAYQVSLVCLLCHLEERYSTWPLSLFDDSVYGKMFQRSWLWRAFRLPCFGAADAW